MNTLDHYDDMYYLASRYANRPDIVQGAGGNFSVKISPDTLLVKASGRTFDEITKDGDGIASIRYDKIREYLLSDESKDLSEKDHLNFLRSHTKTENVPSMEAWFHAILKKYVLHTHSVYVNTLGCSKEGPGLFSGLMDEMGLDHLVLPYHNPGFELGRAVAMKLSENKEIPMVIFLQNHGIIVTADTKEECVDLHSKIEKAIKERLAITRTFDETDLDESETRDYSNLVLFPDQAVYPRHPQIRAAFRFILNEIKRHEFEARAIDRKDSETVTNMESEKYRMNLSK